LGLLSELFEEGSSAPVPHQAQFEVKAGECQVPVWAKDLVMVTAQELVLVRARGRVQVTVRVQVEAMVQGQVQVRE